MRKLRIIGLIGLAGLFGQMNAQTFSTIDSVAITSVKDQNKTGTCWCFSTLSFLESEVLRTKGIELDLSEMFVVNHNMQDRAAYYIRQHGECLYSPGGQAYDVIYCMEHYGLVPQEAMPGIQYGDTLPNHNEVDAVSKGFLNGLLSGKVKKLSPVWKDAFQTIWDTYLGKCPEKFSFGGKEYTPLSFVNFLGLKASDYVTITSYTHHPFYERFALEVPDNWRMHPMYNVPLAEMMDIIDNAIWNGYSVAWDADMSEKGFTRKGLGMLKDPSDSLAVEPVVTQEMRQEEYDNWLTVDDHLMHLFGTAKDENGTPYFMVKNSWGTQKSDYKGIWYVTRPYVASKTLCIMVHKDAIPRPIKRKLGIK